MTVITFGRGMSDIYLLSHMEESFQIDVCIHIWKRNTRYMFVFTFESGIPDKCLYSRMEEPYQKDVWKHIWKRNAG